SPPREAAEKDGNPTDTLGIRGMMQNQYSHVGAVESLWDAQTVLGSTGTQSAVRWYQVPVTGGTIGSALQASTWNPDASSRFIPSLAVDEAGNMAMGYSVSSSTMYPPIRYAGRLTSDPPNTLRQTQRSLIAGTGAQTHVFSDCTLDERWGDCSAMTLDPDGCAFWYTNEYYVTNGGDDHTRIGSFRYPSGDCSGASPPPPAPFILGSPANYASGATSFTTSGSPGLAGSDSSGAADAISGTNGAATGTGGGWVRRG